MLDKSGTASKSGKSHGAPACGSMASVCKFREVWRSFFRRNGSPASIPLEMNHLFFPFLALLGMLTCAQAQSALRWDKKVIELQPGPTEKTARADFNFTNASQKPVVIDRVKPSCGCTTAALEKKSYQPGEKGHITAVFTLGSRKGDQAKSIRVDVRGENPATLLTLVTHIGEPARLEPSLVFWRAGEAPRPKTISVKLPPGVRLTRVSSSDPKFATTLEPVGEQSEYKISVTPDGTAKKATAVLNIQAVTRSNEPRTFQAYAQVKGP